mgnify:CR=1 FL=1
MKAAAETTISLRRWAQPPIPSNMAVAPAGTSPRGALRVVVLDEPTANVDVTNQQNLLDLLRQACTENHVALLLVTHSAEVSDQFERVERLSEFNRPGGQA